MENKSLSSRIKRRNAQGFVGAGTGLGFINPMYGDYTDPKQNGKIADYLREERRKTRLGFVRISKYYSLHKRALTKKFADNHQKLN